MTRCIISRKNHALLVPRTGKSVNLFPNAPALDEYLVVPHDVRSVIMLRAIGYAVPNPINCYYDWKQATPYAVQRATCDMLTTSPRSYVLNGMGTGKTKSALWAWDSLNEQGLAGKMLAVTTLSNLHITWAAEAFSTLPGRKAVVLHGTKQKRLALLEQDADIYIINHDGLRTIQAALSLRTDIDTLVLDELAVYRNNSGRSKEMRKFAQRFKIVWGLTGAPMPQAPTDVWAQAKIVTPHTVPNYFRQAQELLMNKVNQFKFVPKDNAIETAFRMLQPSVRYSLDDVVELPEVVHRTINVPMTKPQKDAYDALSKMFQADVQGEKITAVNAAVAMGKLLQVSGGWVYTGSATGAVPIDSQPRIDALVDLVQANERKVLIFVPYLHTIQGLSPILEKEGIEHAVVHGGVSAGARSSIFQQFQHTDKYKALLAHPACLAHGLTLTAADLIIWYMPITSLDIYDQANARITRIGQKHRQQVVHLQSTSVERKIYGLLRSKANVQAQLLAMLAPVAVRTALRCADSGAGVPARAGSIAQRSRYAGRSHGQEGLHVLHVHHADRVCVRTTASANDLPCPAEAHGGRSADRAADAGGTAVLPDHRRERSWQTENGCYRTCPDGCSGANCCSAGRSATGSADYGSRRGGGE
jgi:hypothetical protein